METFKQIVYRDSDTALMIIPTNEDLQVVPRFVNELSVEDQVPFENLLNFCLTQVDTLLYVVYTQDINRLDIQPIEGDVVCLIVADLDPVDKEIVDAAGVKCIELLNS
jgi:hypothetical protein